MRRALVLIAMAGGVCAPPLLGQQADLPEEFVSKFWGLVADRMYVSAIDAEDAIWVDLTFRNSADWEIGLTWRYSAVGSTLRGNEREIVTVGYRPTALCKQAGTGDTVYIAGWVERSGTCVIEEWVFELPIALGIAEPQGGGDPVVTLTMPVIRKAQILTSSTLGPIHDMIANYSGNELWLLEGSGPRRIHRMDIATSSVSELYSSTAPEMSILENHASLWADLHRDHGFIIWSQIRRRWVPGTRFQEPYVMLVYKDADLDGLVDTVEQRGYSDFYSAYGMDKWIHRYEAGFTGMRRQGLSQWH